MKQKVYRVALLIALLGLSGSAVADSPEGKEVSRTLKKIFDQPSAPLLVDAVAVSGDFSMASWHQHANGGRALLKKTGAVWEIVICGGKGLMTASALEKAGVPVGDATALVAQLRKQEGRLPQQLRQSFDHFTPGEQAAHGQH